MSDIDLGALSRVVPDGVNLNADGSIASYRFSVVFMPYPDRVAGDVAFDFQNWPDYISRKIGSSMLRIFIARDRTDAAIGAAVQKPLSVPVGNISIWPDSTASDWWNKILKLPAPDLVRGSTTTQSTPGQALKDAFKGKYVRPHANWPVIAWDTPTLATFARATRAAEMILQLMTLPKPPQPGAKNKGNANGAAALGQSLLGSVQRRLAQPDTQFLTLHGASRTRSLLARKRKTAQTSGNADRANQGAPDYRIQLFAKQLAVGIGNSHRRRNIKEPKPQDVWSDRADDDLDPNFYQALSDSLQNAADNKERLTKALLAVQEARASYFKSAESGDADKSKAAKDQLTAARAQLKNARALSVVGGNGIEPIVAFLLADSALQLPLPKDSASFNRVRSAHALYRAAMSVDHVPPSGRVHFPEAPPDSDKAAKAIARKLQGLYSYPSLAKYFGLIIDVNVPKEQFDSWEQAAAVKSVGDVAYGYVAVDLGSSGQMSWTSYKRRSATLDDYTKNFHVNKSQSAMTPRHPFQPCTAHEIQDAIQNGTVQDANAYSQYFGLQNLGESIASAVNGRRFALETIEVHSATNNNENAVRNSQNRSDGGEIAGRSDQSLGGTRTAGIAIIDRGRAADTQTGITTRQQPSQLPPLMAEGIKHTFLDTETDLTIGLRIDIAVQPTSGAKSITPDRWFGLNERITTFPDVLTNPAAKGDYFPVRDRGFVRPADRVMKVSPPRAQFKGTKSNLTSQQKFQIVPGHTISIGDGSTTATAPVQPKSDSNWSVNDIFDAVTKAGSIKIKASLDADGSIELSATDTNAIIIGGTATPQELGQFGLSAGTTMPPGAYIGDPITGNPALPKGQTITVDDESPKAAITSTSPNSVTVKQILDAVSALDGIKVKVQLNTSGQLQFDSSGQNCISIGGTADPTQIQHQLGLTFGTHQPSRYTGSVGNLLPSTPLSIGVGTNITIGSNAVIFSATSELTAQQIVNGVNNAAGLDVKATLDADNRIELHPVNANTILIGGTADLAPFGLTATTANPGSNAVIAYDTIATWSNWSLSVPSSECPMTPHCDDGTDLPIDVNYALPLEANADQDSVLMPPLRYDREYSFGARAVFANGASLWSTEAYWLYGQYPRFILGQPSGANDPDAPYQFVRQEPIGRPDVHLAAGLEKLPAKKGSATAESDIDRCLGESITKLVVRTAANGQPVYGSSTSRWIVPPRVPFEAVEIEGKFDDAARHGQAMPHGAFRNFILCPQTGSFPPSVEGQARLDLCITPTAPCREPGKVPARPGTTGSDTIALLRLRHSGLPSLSDELQNQYYPDPRAKFVRISIQLKDPNAKPISATIPIYPNNGKWPDAIPLRIDLVRLSETTEKKGQRCVVTGPQLRFAPGPHQLLTIALARGEDAKLDVWCTDDVGPTLTNNPGVRDLFDILGLSPGKSNPPSDQWDPVRKILTQGKRLTNDNLEMLLLASAPFSAIACKLQLQLTHAVEAPLREPEMLGAPENTQKEYGVVRFNGADKDAWQDYVRQHPGNPPSTWVDQAANATKAFFFGKVLLDRATAGQVTAFGSWPVWDDDKIIKKDGPNSYKKIDPRPARVKLFDPIDVPDTPASEFDLLLGDGDTALGTQYDFGDTKCRTVIVRLQAYSRFAANFPKGDAKILRPSTKEIKIEIPSTARPNAPAIDRILPAFVWKTDNGTKDHKHYVATSRRSRVRIFLNRPWYSSGENELLAVVCWPPYLFGLNGGTEPACYNDSIPSIPLSDIDDTSTYGQIERWVTRWGADPTKLSEDTLQNWIPADYLRGWKQTGAMLDLPLPGPDKGGPSSSAPGTKTSCVAKVAVAGYEPEFDGLENRWICDVQLEGGGYFPFIRLGLARWQQNSIAGRELSAPVAEWIQIPPARDAGASVSADGGVDVHVKGPRYYQAKTQATGPDVARANQPLMIFRLMEAPAAAGGAFIPVAEFPERERELMADPDHPGQWRGKFMLPRNSRGRRFVIFIEEYELLAADDVDGLARRGPTFACKLDLPDTG